MKKILALVICVFLAFSFAACDLLNSAPEDSNIGNIEIGNGDFSNATSEDSEIKKAEIENGKAVEFGGISIVLPADYQETEIQGIKTYYTDKYPQIGDNINFVETNEKITLADCSKALFEYSYEQAFSSMGAQFEITNYEQIKIDGSDSVKVETNVNLNGTSMKQIQYTILLKNSYVTITFTDVSGEYTKEFNDIATTIEVK